MSLLKNNSLNIEESRLTSEISLKNLSISISPSSDSDIFCDMFSNEKLKPKNYKKLIISPNSAFTPVIPKNIVTKVSINLEEPMHINYLKPVTEQVLLKNFEPPQKKTKREI